MGTNIIGNVLIQQAAYLRKETALKNVLRYNFAGLRIARFSEFEGENSLLVNIFLRSIY